MKTATRFPKFYVNKYGVFYESQRLYQYCRSSKDNFYYLCPVILEKFITHYYNYVPEMYFRFHEEGKKRTWTLPCERLLRNIL